MLADRRFSGVLALAVCLAIPLFAAVPVAGQEPATPPDAAGSGTEAFDPAAATAAYLNRLSPEEKNRSDAYFEGGYWLQLWGFLYGLGVAWLFLGTGLSNRMRDFAERRGRWRWLQTAIYGLQYVFLATLFGLPWAVYTGFYREHRYDLSNLGFGEWMVEQGKGLAIGLILGTLGIVLLYAVLRVTGRRWWLWGALMTLGFLGVMLVIGPVYIAPVFNEYTRLEDPQVRDPILTMARANGVPVDDVWVFDASKQHKRISANVSGFLGTERVSLNDNLLERTSLPEIEAVMGHELGHYVLNHIYEMYFQLGLVVVVGFAFVAFAFDRVRNRWGGSWGIRGVTDVAGLPLLAVLLSVYFFALTPVLNTIVRVNEAEADLFGLNAAREPEGFAEVALKLGEYRKLDPGPIEEWIFFDHPSGRARIRMAMDWKAAHLGK